MRAPCMLLACFNTITCLLQAPEGQPPDVWHRIANCVLDSAETNTERFPDEAWAREALMTVVAYVARGYGAPYSVAYPFLGR